MLILGPLGRGVTRLKDTKSGEHAGYMQPVHAALTFRKGDLFQGYAWFVANGLCVEPGDGLVANDAPEVFWDGRSSLWGNFVGGGALVCDSFSKEVASAYRAAVGARFEHGAHG